MVEWDQICRDFAEIRASGYSKENSRKPIKAEIIRPEEEVSDDKEKCSESKYIRRFVMPLVHEALEQMINQAKKEDVFKFRSQL